MQPKSNGCWAMAKVYEFHWRATNRFSRKLCGKCLAESRQELEKQLLQKGYRDIKISRNFTLPQAPAATEITQLLSQLALLVNSHIRLRNALIMLQESCSNGRLYLWLKMLIQQLEAGHSFSYAVAQGKPYLHSQEILLIKMGESSGNLATVLKNIAENRQKSDQLAKKIQKILFYPLLILGVAISISALLLIFIVPKFADLYANKQQSLPIITEWLFQLSHFLMQYYIEILLLILLSIGLIMLLSKKTKVIKQLKFRLFNQLPILSRIMQHSRILFFCQNSYLMLNAQLRLDTILKTFIDDKESDPILNNELTQAFTLLKQGYRLNEVLSPYIFNPQVVQMIAIGEQSGNLTALMKQISEIYQQKLDDEIDILAQLLEPLLMIMMGLIVGIIMLGLYLPIFNMGALVE